MLSAGRRVQDTAAFGGEYCPAERSMMSSSATRGRLAGSSGASVFVVSGAFGGPALGFSDADYGAATDHSIPKSLPAASFSS